MGTFLRSLQSLNGLELIVSTQLVNQKTNVDSCARNLQKLSCKTFQIKAFLLSFVNLSTIFSRGLLWQIKVIPCQSKWPKYSLETPESLQLLLTFCLLFNIRTIKFIMKKTTFYNKSSFFQTICDESRTNYVRSLSSHFTY